MNHCFIITYLFGVFLSLLLFKLSIADKVKNQFVFKHLVLNRKRLDASYFFRYDKIFWDGKVIAIGDLHGDITSLQIILHFSDIVDEEGNWKAENLLLIQVGDILDRGIYGSIIYDYLFKLQKQAEEKKSRVILLLGNHEQRNMCGEFEDVHKDEIKEFFNNDKDQRIKAFSSKTGSYFKRLIRIPSIIKVNDSIFTHGGISEETSQFGINFLNTKIRLQIENKCKVLAYDSYDYLNDKSVLWYKDLSRSVKFNHYQCCALLKKNLKKFNAHHLVVGHTRQMSHEITSFCDNTFFLIDTGMSQAINNGQAFPSYLQIEKGYFKSIHIYIDHRNKKKNCHKEIYLINYQNKKKKKVCLYSKEKEFYPSFS